MRLRSSACGSLCGGPSPARGCRGLQQVTAGLLGWRSFPGDVCQRLQAVWTAPAGQGVLSAPAGEARGVAPHPAMRRTPQHGGRLPPRDHSVEVGESWVSLERCSSRGAPSVAAGMHLQTRATDGGTLVWGGRCPRTWTAVSPAASLQGPLDSAVAHGCSALGSPAHTLPAQPPTNSYSRCLHTKLIYFNAHTRKSFTSKSSSLVNKFIIFIHILSQKLGVSCLENSIFHLSFMCGKIVNQ